MPTSARLLIVLCALVSLPACGDDGDGLEDRRRADATDICTAAVQKELGSNARSFTTEVSRVSDGLYEVKGEASPAGAGSSPTTPFTCTAESTGSRVGVRSLTLDR